MHYMTWHKTSCMSVTAAWSNSRHKQTNVTAKVGRKCDNVYVQNFFLLQMYPDFHALKSAEHHQRKPRSHSEYIQRALRAQNSIIQYVRVCYSEDTQRTLTERAYIRRMPFFTNQGGEAKYYWQNLLVDGRRHAGQSE